MKTNQSLLISAACVLTAAIVVLAIFGGLVIGYYFLLLGAFVALSFLFVAATGKLDPARLFELPVFLTVVALINYGFTPIQALFNPEQMDSHLQGNRDLVIALLLVIVGMLAFWFGCKWMVPKTKQPRLVLSQPGFRNRILVITVLMYFIGFACKTYLLHAHMFAYTESGGAYYENLAAAQVWMFFSQFSTFALLMICIEHFSNPGHRVTKRIFWIIFLSECGWGLISGMKEALLINLIVVSMIYTIIVGKIAKKWIIATVLGLVIIYPFYNNYRVVLGSRSAGQVSDFTGAAKALTAALTPTPASDGSEKSESWLQSGSDQSVSRLDLLQDVAVIISLDDYTAQLHGDSKLWMIPFYPFVPRMIWPSKPVLDDGARFNFLETGSRSSSQAVPYIADCYIYYGIPGVILGMLILGLFAQKLTNQMNGIVTKYQIFQYSVLFLNCYKLEMGVFSLWVAILKIIPLLLLIGWVAYGSIRSPRLRNNRTTDDPFYTGVLGRL